MHFTLILMPVISFIYLESLIVDVSAETFFVLVVFLAIYAVFKVHF